METYRERRQREQEEAEAAQERRRRAARQSELEELRQKAQEAEEALATTFSKMRSDDTSMLQKKRALEETLGRWYDRIDALQENA